MYDIYQVVNYRRFRPYVVGNARLNVAFGGPKRNRLFIAAASSLYAVYVGTRGAQTP